MHADEDTGSINQAEALREELLYSKMGDNNSTNDAP